MLMSKEDVLLFFTAMAVAGVANEIKTLPVTDAATKALDLGKTAAQAFVLQNPQHFDVPKPQPAIYPSPPKEVFPNGPKT